MHSNYIKKEIEKYHFPLSTEEINDFVKIAEILTNDKQVIDRQLKKLEKLMRDDLANKKINCNIELFTKFIDPKDKNKFKILSDTLYQWAIKNKFGSVFAKINRYLAPAEFLSILQKGVFFKDIGVPPKHGAWTHFLQWFILIEENNDSNYLKLNPLHLYKALGEKGSVMVGSRRATLWDLIFDVQSGNNSYDFRSPDTLHNYILNISTEFPCLQTILSKGFTNINVLDSRIPSLSFKNYEENQNKLIVKI